jgi:uncharacterized protein
MGVVEDGAANLKPALERIAAALERLSPPEPRLPDLSLGAAWRWDGAARTLALVPQVARIDLALLQGVDRQKAKLLANTQAFAAGRPANNALLWGARGMGKSSLIKAVHASVAAGGAAGLHLAEIERDEIETLPDLMRLLRQAKGARFLLFCDDLSFEAGDGRFKALKAVLEGGLEGRPANCLFYATSNRRHLVPREIIENEQGSAINPADVVDDKVSLSDRFGLWLGFHGCDQETYLAMVRGYANALALPIADETLREALQWSVTRGSRSGRVAWQFIQDIAGRG